MPDSSNPDKCRKECGNISRILNRPLPGTLEWQDVFLEGAAGAPKFTKMANDNLEVREWLAIILPRKYPPTGKDFEQVVPPLDLEALTELRRSTDAARKRLVRQERPILSLDAILLPAIAGSKQEWSIETEELLQKAVETLKPVDRRIWALALEGRELQEIGDDVGLTASTVCGRLAKAIVKIKDYIERQSR